MPKKNSKSESADVHKELSGFDIKIDEFGKMSFNYPIDKLNDFLNKNTQDKKLPASSEEEE